jgi:hypothetical protein
MAAPLPAQYESPSVFERLIQVAPAATPDSGLAKGSLRSKFKDGKSLTGQQAGGVLR